MTHSAPRAPDASAEHPALSEPTTVADRLNDGPDGGSDDLRPWLGAVRGHPAPGIVDLWWFRLTERAGDLERLSADEIARAQRLCIASKRQQLISSRGALRRILAQYVGGDPQALRFAYGEHDKPWLQQSPDLTFNLSHSGQWAVVAVSSGLRLGVDVEQRRPARAFTAIAKRYFTPLEQRWARAVPNEIDPDRFYDLWTVKEAYLKAIGTGLSFASTGFCVDCAVAAAPRLRSSEYPGDNPALWALQRLRAPSGYAAALCTDRGAVGVEVCVRRPHSE